MLFFKNTNMIKPFSCSSNLIYSPSLKDWNLKPQAFQCPSKSNCSLSFKCCYFPFWTTQLFQDSLICATMSLSILFPYFLSFSICCDFAFIWLKCQFDFESYISHLELFCPLCFIIPSIHFHYCCIIFWFAYWLFVYFSSLDYKYLEGKNLICPSFMKHLGYWVSFSKISTNISWIELYKFKIYDFLSTWHNLMNINELVLNIIISNFLTRSPIFSRIFVCPSISRIPRTYIHIPNVSWAGPICGSSLRTLYYMANGASELEGLPCQLEET